jgi:hypothetical protein
MANLHQRSIREIWEATRLTSFRGKAFDTFGETQGGENRERTTAEPDSADAGDDLGRGANDLGSPTSEGSPIVRKAGTRTAPQKR